jgi:hypothetical protein
MQYANAKPHEHSLFKPTVPSHPDHISIRLLASPGYHLYAINTLRGHHCCGMLPPSHHRALPSALQQLQGILASHAACSSGLLARCNPWRQPCHNTVAQPGRATGAQQSACSSQSQASSSVAAASSQDRGLRSSLRSDLGSGSGLGTWQDSSSGSSDPAQRRQSLLVGGKRFYETVLVQPCSQPSPHHQQQVQQSDGQSSSSSSSRSSSRSSSSSSNNLEQGYQLLLRNYPIKTPAQQVLVLPTRSLALAVAAEWEWLPTGKPVPHKMPLTGLACTAIDQPKSADRVIEHLLKYVHTDGACIRWVGSIGGVQAWQ